MLLSSANFRVSRSSYGLMATVVEKVTLFLTVEGGSVAYADPFLSTERIRGIGRTCKGVATIAVAMAAEGAAGAALDVLLLVAFLTEATEEDAGSCVLGC
uniref:(northern house mosquito) hypothetical protein n=1 Tax=Culex pipiens TaxID=7175 RepID=A0A8D8FL08_CULPI